VVSFALAQVGKAYRHASAGPDSFDCSGLVVAAHARLGIHLPHGTGALSARGRAVSRNDLRPGDLVFTDPGHVGIYIGGGEFVHASTPRGGVKRSTIHRFAYARRIVG
jgi:cell wall-associated NlpC family hydrolase